MIARTTARGLIIPAVMLAILAFVLTSCPANRDGMPGQLASAKEEAQSAARSAALALDLWAGERSSRQLVSVQLADARDEVAKAYDGIAVLKAEDSADLSRQSMLTRSMTDIIATLNQANAAVRALPNTGNADRLRRTLLEASDELERNYR